MPALRLSLSAAASSPRPTSTSGKRISKRHEAGTESSEHVAPLSQARPPQEAIRGGRSTMTMPSRAGASAITCSPQVPPRRPPSAWQRLQTARSRLSNSSCSKCRRSRSNCNHSKRSWQERERQSATDRYHEVRNETEASQDTTPARAGVVRVYSIETHYRLNEFPRAHDAAEPRIELFVCCNLVEKSSVNEPHLARIAHDSVLAEEHDPARVIHLYLNRTLNDT